jgi:membrane fusion protein (multidrug efflux system)
MKRGLIVLTSVLMLGLIGVQGAHWFQYISSHEETDDAYVTGHLHQVSARLNGTVEKVLVDDNEHVKAGQVLVMLDARDYQVKVDQALAALEQAQRETTAAQSTVVYQDVTAQGQNANAEGTISGARAAIAKAQAAVKEATDGIAYAQSDLTGKQAELERAHLDYQRYDVLEKQGAISTSQRDAAKRDYLVAQAARDSAQQALNQAHARLQQAQESVTAANAQLAQAQGQMQLARASAVQTRVNQDQVSTNLAAVARAQAALNEAKLNLSYCAIVAPTDGRVGKKTVEEGQRVEPGQPLLTIVSDDEWVVANYKETQLKKMHPGQKVEIEIDSFPDHKFAGRVQSFSPASGASFAVLPSDNATGNFTKIVQRVPVKILFDRDSIHGYEDRLAPGLSVISHVDVSR